MTAPITLKPLGLVPTDGRKHLRNATGFTRQECILRLSAAQVKFDFVA